MTPAPASELSPIFPLRVIFPVPASALTFKVPIAVVVPICLLEAPRPTAPDPDAIVRLLVSPTVLSIVELKSTLPLLVAISI